MLTVTAASALLALIPIHTRVTDHLESFRAIFRQDVHLFAVVTARKILTQKIRATRNVLALVNVYAFKVTVTAALATPKSLRTGARAALVGSNSIDTNFKIQALVGIRMALVNILACTGYRVP
jgi:hypothetical protein